MTSIQTFSEVRSLDVTWLPDLEWPGYEIFATCARASSKEFRLGGGQTWVGSLDNCQLIIFYLTLWKSQNSAFRTIDTCLTRTSSQKVFLKELKGAFWFLAYSVSNGCSVKLKAPPCSSGQTASNGGYAFCLENVKILVNPKVKSQGQVKSTSGHGFIYSLGGQDA